jgi:purine-binding chemotaxis protein CheW
MVDLVKIRKKAKKQVVDRSSQVAGEESAPPPAEAEPLSTQHSALSTVAPSVNEGPGGKGGATKSAEAEPLSTQHSALSTESEPQSSKLTKFKEEAGRLRQSAETTTEVASPLQQLEVLTFVIAGESYAVDIERIVEIVTPRPATRVPNADGAIVGIISLRGTIVTLLDVRSRLRHARVAETPDTRIIVVDHHGEPVGFEVDRVLRVIKLAAGEVEAHPVVHTSELDESIRGVFRHAGALTILIDFDKLLGLRALAAARA